LAGAVESDIASPVDLEESSAALGERGIVAEQVLAAAAATQGEDGKVFEEDKLMRPIARLEGAQKALLPCPGLLVVHQAIPVNFAALAHPDLPRSLRIQPSMR
jgi:hypothetical protein